MDSSNSFVRNIRNAKKRIRKPTKKIKLEEECMESSIISHVGRFRKKMAKRKNDFEKDEYSLFDGNNSMPDSNDRFIDDEDDLDWNEPIAKLKSIKSKEPRIIKEKKSYICPQCNKEFLTAKLWRLHKSDSNCKFIVKRGRKSKELDANNKIQTFPCLLCSEVLPTRKSFKAHKRDHHPEDVFEEQEEEDLSQKYHFDEIQDLYICDICSAEFLKVDEVDQHVKTHERKFTCVQCKETFKSPFLMGIHSMSHDSEGKIQCPLCSYVSCKTFNFKSHINCVHLKKFLYNCNVCGKGINQLKMFQEHQNIHTGERPFECVVCSKRFTLTRYLLIHQIRNHQVGSTGQKIENHCVGCNRYFYKPQSLAEHIEECRKKKKEKSQSIYLCNSCGKSFTSKANLVGHIRNHTGENPFVCSWCGKGFMKRQYLRYHERVHTGEKPYSCEFCGKGFAHRTPFRVHRRTHTGERPYVCPFCTKTFTTNQGLKLHKKNCGETHINSFLKYDIPSELIV